MANSLPNMQEMLEMHHKLIESEKSRLHSTNDRVQSLELDHTKLSKELQKLRDTLDLNTGHWKGMTRGLQAKLQETLAELQEELAEKEKTLAETREDLAVTEKELKAIERYLLKIKPGCDYIEENYEIRTENRGKEKEALEKATELLKGTPAYKAAVNAAEQEAP